MAACFAVRHPGDETRLTKGCRRQPTADVRAPRLEAGAPQARMRRYHTSCSVSRHSASPREPAQFPTSVQAVVAMSVIPLQNKPFKTV